MSLPNTTLLSAAPPKIVLILAAAFAVVSCLASWSLWRLAGAGARCDVRIASAVALGVNAARDKVAGQEAGIAADKVGDDAVLQEKQAAIPARQVERILVYRDRPQKEPAPECRVTPEQVLAINEVLK